MFLLIDECCGKGLSAAAESQNHVAQRTVDTPGLGQGATDADIFAFAAEAGAVVVTINQADFIKLAGLSVPSCGLILLPALRGMELTRLFRSVLEKLVPVFDASEEAIVSVMPNGEIEIRRG